jgi:hypothetical protein
MPFADHSIDLPMRYWRFIIHNRWALINADAGLDLPAAGFAVTATPLIVRAPATQRTARMPYLSIDALVTQTLCALLQPLAPILVQLASDQFQYRGLHLGGRRSIMSSLIALTMGAVATLTFVAL